MNRARCVLSAGLLVSWAGLGLPGAFAARVLIPEGTPIQLQVVRSISSEDNEEGDKVSFLVVGPVKIDNAVVIRQGAQAQGVVKESKSPGKLHVRGKPKLVVDSLMVYAVGNVPVSLRLKPSRGADPENSRRITVTTDSKDEPARIAAGDAIAAYVDRDTYVDGAEAPPPAPALAPVPAENAPSAAPAPAPSPSTPSPAPRAAEPKPAPPAPSGDPEILTITSTPQAADIELDSNFIGTTPAELRLTPGQHKLAFSKSGYKRQERTLMAVPGAKVSFAVELEKE